LIFRILASKLFSSMNPFTILAAIIGYYIVLILISLYTSRKANNEGFFIGNRQSPWYVVSFGMIGASISGVTFISVPGWVITSKFYYMQMVFGYILGYAAIVHILLPVYYKLQLTSIYTYLESRFNVTAYKTGAWFFIISRVVGASFRLFLVANVLQITIFGRLHIPFIATTGITLLMIYLSTFRGGIKTIIWTDTFQTFFLLLSVVLCVIFIGKHLHLNLGTLVQTIADDDRSTMFDFTSWKNGSFFFKQFFSGAFITIVMTGLDQDLMQKNLSCKNLRDAQKNMYWYSALLVIVNLLFLSLGVLLVIFSEKNGIKIPAAAETDALFPMLATGGYLPALIGFIFAIGLTASANASADSALTALTTSFTLDILNAGKRSEIDLKRLRYKVHIAMSLIICGVIYIFKLVNDEAVISKLFKAAGYTYGPLLGLFAFGLFTKRTLKGRLIPLVCILSPIITYLLNTYSVYLFAGYKFGFEILILNGALTFFGLYLISERKNTG
jgi:solute:Na+ symporter, SSS family